MTIFPHLFPGQNYTGDEAAFDATAAAYCQPVKTPAVHEQRALSTEMFVTGPGSRISKAQAYHDKLMNTAQKLSEVGHVTVHLEKKW